MPAILITLVIISALAMLTHRALGSPTADTVAVLKVCGWLTIAFITVSQGTDHLATAAALLEPLLKTGPSG